MFSNDYKYTWGFLKKYIENLDEFIPDNPTARDFCLNKAMRKKGYCEIKLEAQCKDERYAARPECACYHDMDDKGVGEANYTKVNPKVKDFLNMKGGASLLKGIMTPICSLGLCRDSIWKTETQLTAADHLCATCVQVDYIGDDVVCNTGACTQTNNCTNIVKNYKNGNTEASGPLEEAVVTATATLAKALASYTTAVGKTAVAREKLEKSNTDLEAAVIASAREKLEKSNTDLEAAVIAAATSLRLNTLKNTLELSKSYLEVAEAVEEKAKKTHLAAVEALKQAKRTLSEAKAISPWGEVPGGEVPGGEVPGLCTDGDCKNGGKCKEGKCECKFLRRGYSCEKLSIMAILLIIGGIVVLIAGIVVVYKLLT
jgi:hypothetical protein